MYSLFGEVSVVTKAVITETKDVAISRKLTPKVVQATGCRLLLYSSSLPIQLQNNFQIFTIQVIWAISLYFKVVLRVY